MKLKELLKYTIVDSLNLQFQKKIQKNLINLFKLDADFKILLRDIDFNKYTFSADLYCLYYEALLNKKVSFDTTNISCFCRLDEKVRINLIEPAVSIADSYIANSSEMNADLVVFELPSLENVEKISIKLQQALSLLSPIKETCINSCLLNSIAIYDGIGAIPTSASTIFAQNRIYIKYVGDEYPLFYYLDMLIHEVSHQYFNLINSLYSIISDYNQTLLSVARNKERPIYGIFHAVFVLYRLITIYPLIKNLLKAEELEEIIYNPENYLYARFFQIPFNYHLRLSVYFMKFEVSLKQLLASEFISQLGKDLLRAMQVEVYTVSYNNI